MNFVLDWQDAFRNQNLKSLSIRIGFTRSNILVVCEPDKNFNELVPRKLCFIFNVTTFTTLIRAFSVVNCCERKLDDYRCCEVISYARKVAEFIKSLAADSRKAVTISHNTQKHFFN